MLPLLDRASAARHWTFERDGISYLNHGSFGAVAVPVQHAADQLRQQLWQNPFSHLVYDHYGLWYQRGQGLMEENRLFLASLLGASPDNLVLTTGATDGVQAILRSLSEAGHFASGDEIIITSWGYGACNSIVHHIAKVHDLKVVTVTLPLPVTGADDVRHALAAAITPRTKLALIDHISSAQAAILPLANIVSDMRGQGVPVLVDGAHALGQIPLQLESLGADFYVGTCHKHFCAPVGSGYLYAQPRWHNVLTPNVISHGYDDDTPGLSRFIKLFNWQGTRDYTPNFVLREANDFLSSLSPEGMLGVMAANHHLAMDVRDMLREAFGMPMPLVPDDMTGTMATIALPPCDAMALRQHMEREHGIYTQMIGNIGNGQPGIRITVHAYNSRPQFERLRDVLRPLFNA